MSERYDESNNMNPTVETIAHRHRIGPPRWGFGLFRGPVPRPMAWADIGLSRCDVGAPMNDTRAGFGSGTHFQTIIDGGRFSPTMPPRHAITHTTPPTSPNVAFARHPHQTIDGIKPATKSTNRTEQTSTYGKHAHRTTNRAEQQSTHDKHERPQKFRNPERGGPMTA